MKFPSFSQNFLVTSLNKSIRRQTRSAEQQQQQNRLQQQQQQLNASGTGKVNFAFSGTSQLSSLKLGASTNSASQLTTERKQEEEQQQQQQKQEQQQQQPNKHYLEPLMQQPSRASLVSLTSSIVRKCSSSSQAQSRSPNNNYFNQADRPKSL